MQKRVLDVGNCSADHAAIRSILQRDFSAQVVRAHGLEDALAALQADSFDLVLVNRQLDRDESDGRAIIQAIKSEPGFESLPVMMIANHADDQQRAVDAGAVWGFGKSQLRDPATAQRLRSVLGQSGE